MIEGAKVRINIHFAKHRHIFHAFSDVFGNKMQTEITFIKKYPKIIRKDFGKNARNDYLCPRKRNL